MKSKILQYILVSLACICCNKKQVQLKNLKGYKTNQKIHLSLNFHKTKNSIPISLIKQPAKRPPSIPSTTLDLVHKEKLEIWHINNDGQIENTSKPKNKTNQSSFPLGGSQFHLTKSNPCVHFLLDEKTSLFYISDKKDHFINLFNQIEFETIIIAAGRICYQKDDHYQIDDQSQYSTFSSNDNLLKLLREENHLSSSLNLNGFAQFPRIRNFFDVFSKPKKTLSDLDKVNVQRQLNAREALNQKSFIDWKLQQEKHNKIIDKHNTLVQKSKEAYDAALQADLTFRYTPKPNPEITFEILSQRKVALVNYQAFLQTPVPKKSNQSAYAAYLNDKQYARKLLESNFPQENWPWGTKFTRKQYPTAEQVSDSVKDIRTTELELKNHEAAWKKLFILEQRAATAEGRVTSFRDKNNFQKKPKQRSGKSATNEIWELPALESPPSSNDLIISALAKDSSKTIDIRKNLMQQNPNKRTLDESVKSELESYTVDDQRVFSDEVVDDIVTWLTFFGESTPTSHLRVTDSNHKYYFSIVIGGKPYASIDP